MKENLKNIITPGDLAKIIVEEGDKTLELKTIVEGINAEEKVLINAPFYKCNYYPIREGDLIRLNIHKNGIGIVDFNARVVKRIKINNFTNLVLEKLDFHKIHQRRNFYRLKIVRNVKFDKEDILKGITKDISAGGMLCVTHGKLEIDEEVFVTLDVDSEELKLKGKVLESKKVEDSKYRHESRIEFLNVSEKDRLKIVSFIFGIQRKRKRNGVL